MHADIEDAEGGTNYQMVTEPRGCFIAGTLVHTKNGLVPIEEIKVGDWVLSQPEAKGERLYKRVTKTFVRENQEIYLFRFFRDLEEGMDIDQVGVTAEHPFWVKDRGWFPAKAFGDIGPTIELWDGSDAFVLCSRHVFKSAPVKEGVGWAVGVWGVDPEHGGGYEVDFNQQQIKISESGHYFLYGRGRDESGKPFEMPLGDTLNPEFRATVYDLEVEDFHTYYVGRLGAWA